MARILIVLTSHATLGTTGKPTGFFYEELAAPYYAFVDAGHAVEIASIVGGAPPADPSSLDADEAKRPAAVRRLLADAAAMDALARTAPIDAIDPVAYDAVFLPGGHGTMWDFPQSAALARAVSAIYARAGVVGAVCHGPAGLVGATRPDGHPLVEGLRVNGFTDAEEAAVGLTDVVPFLLESRLVAQGARFEKAGAFEPFAVRDGRLVTGQNPMSSEPAAALMLEALAEARAAA
ncbi:type 1 glutamine amidotransferase domain-containing protein [Salinarimonas rosea]|uniref:type 1 glutamine amidotransferase domain-containing protein n=1 Tax=Salinarimonas rosea TaxID=552063 RepID=UPI0004083376|nr:type 1 glutamine amidotransferase domain-containing protein [Salinarimonas rosea]